MNSCTRLTSSKTVVSRRLSPPREHQRSRASSPRRSSGARTSHAHGKTRQPRRSAATPCGAPLLPVATAWHVLHPSRLDSGVCRRKTPEKVPAPGEVRGRPEVPGVSGDGHHGRALRAHQLRARPRWASLPSTPHAARGFPPALPGRSSGTALPRPAAVCCDGSFSPPPAATAPPPEERPSRSRLCPSCAGPRWGRRGARQGDFVTGNLALPSLRLGRYPLRSGASPPRAAAHTDRPAWGRGTARPLNAASVARWGSLPARPRWGGTLASRGPSARSPAAWGTGPRPPPWGARIRSPAF